MLAAAVTFPLSFGWVRFESAADSQDIYRAFVFGVRVFTFPVDSWMAPLIFNVLDIAAVMVLLGLALAILVAFPVGIISATRRNSAADLIVTTVALIGVSMPSFFLGILLIFIFSLNLRWLPPIGFTPIVKDLGANGLVGLMTLGIVLWLFSNRHLS